MYIYIYKYVYIYIYTSITEKCATTSIAFLNTLKGQLKYPRGKRLHNKLENHRLEPENSLFLWKRSIHILYVDTITTLFFFRNLNHDFEI